MPVPKRKKSKARRNNRRAHIHLQATASQKCPQCGEARLPHRVCTHCGFYKGKEIVRQEEAR